MSIVSKRDLLFGLGKLEGDTDPNAIHVYQSNSENKYRAVWNTDGPNSLSASELNWLGGDKSFSGFKPGQSFIVAIGHDNMPLPDGGKVEFKPVWVAKIEVSPDGT